MITVNPTNPSSDDNVELVFNGGVSNCVSNISQTVDGSQFELTVTLANFCGIPPTFLFSWPLGRLEAGNYTAALIVGSTRDGFTQNAVEAFTVSQGTLPFLHPSPVPVFSIPSLVLLGGALVWIAKKALRGEVASKRHAR